MIGHLVARVRTADRLLLFGAAMVVVHWLVETYVDTLVGMGTYANRLLPYRDINELWMRGIIVILIVMFTRYAHASVARQKRNVEALRASEEHLQIALTREQEARRQAEQAVRVRDDFLAAASHDLRTPLATVVSRTGLVQGRLGRKQALPAEWLSDQLEAMGEAAQAMLAAVEGITDAARLQMGRELVLRVEAVDLSALVRTIVRTFNEASAWSGAAPLEASIADGVLVDGDRARLRRVVENLLGNAVKYSPDGTPVQVEVRATDEGAVLAVRDRGVGIADDELPHIFSPFYRASTAGDVPGAGIGLASAKTIVQQHGGRISVASALGAGTTVVVVLPPPGTDPHGDGPPARGPRRRQTGVAAADGHPSMP
jgi:signal transduction histidine kinase